MKRVKYQSKLKKLFLQKQELRKNYKYTEHKLRLKRTRVRSFFF